MHNKMVDKIIIKGNFTVYGIEQLKQVAQPLEYLEILLGFPTPIITVDGLKSAVGKIGKITSVEKFKESEIKK